MSHKPKPTPASALPSVAIADAEADEVATLAEQRQELDQIIAEVEAQVAAAEQEGDRLDAEHAAATTWEVAEPLEQQIAAVQARLRRLRGELVALRADREAVEREEQEEAKAPHKERLRALVGEELPARVQRFKDWLGGLSDTLGPCVDVLHLIGVEAAAAGLARAGELAEPDRAAFAAGAAGRADQLVYAAIGTLFELSPRVLDRRKLQRPAVLDQVLLDVTTIARHGGSAP